MQQILVVYYSQSGQLKDIVNQFVAPFQSAGIGIDFYSIEMEESFPFPWTDEAFFGAFPESFLQIPQPIKPIKQEFLEKEYSLIILAYQVWYLSPSIPINSFLKSTFAKDLLYNKPVITLSGTRNMWISSQEKIKLLLLENKAHLVGNIALTDKHPNHISVLTIVHWLFTGKKDRYLGIFPLPGVSQKDIESASMYGKIALEYLQKDIYDKGLQKEIIERKGVIIKPFLLSAEHKANRLFRIWATMIYGNRYRKTLLKCFHLYLYIAIWVLMPIVWCFYWLTYPFFYRKIQKDIRKAESV